jgi:spore maturation protein CgeB
VPIAFVGSHEPFRAGAVEAVRDLGVVARGPGWPGGALYGEDFIRAFSNATIGLNIHQFFGEPASEGRYGTGANRRVFELAGIGTAQLCDAKADLAQNFTEGREIVTFRSGGELHEKARWLLGAPAERAALAERARSRALAEHTWRHRLEALLAGALR